MLNEVKTLVETAVRQQDLLLSEPIDLSRGEDSPLYGVEGTIDSMTLVSIIVDTEEKIRHRFGAEVHLADTSHLPATATPFATLGTLCAYVMNRLESALTTTGAEALAN